MKRILQLLCLLLIPSLLWGQTANVTKTPGSNLIKESLVIGSGTSLTITGTGTFSAGSYIDTSGGIGTPTAGHAQYGGSSSYGASIIGNGSAYDFGLFNKNGTDVMHVATGTTTATFAGTINTTAATGNPTVSATMTAAGGAGQFPLFQLIDSRTSGTTWNIENGRTLGLLSLRSTGGDHVTINGTTGATTVGATLTVGTNTTPSIPSVPRAVFTHTVTASGAPTIAVEGSPGGYGAGVDFVSALGDATTTFKSMAKIVSDGTAPWSSTASTQAANLTVWTSVDGSLVKSATFDGASLAIASTSAIKGIRTATATTNFGDLIAGATAFVDITVTGAALNDSVTVNCKDISNSFTAVSLTAFVVADNSVRIVARNNGAITATTVTGTSRVTVTSF